jgi:hypothetical protein
VKTGFGLFLAVAALATGSACSTSNVPTTGSIDGTALSFQNGTLLLEPSGALVSIVASEKLANACQLGDAAHPTNPFLHVVGGDRMLAMNLVNDNGAPVVAGTYTIVASGNPGAGKHAGAVVEVLSNDCKTGETWTSTAGSVTVDAFDPTAGTLTGSFDITFSEGVAPAAGAKTEHITATLNLTACDFKAGAPEGECPVPSGEGEGEGEGE